jgi:hypothetical protein
LSSSCSCSSSSSFVSSANGQMDLITRTLLNLTWTILSVLHGVLRHCYAAKSINVTVAVPLCSAFQLSSSSIYVSIYSYLYVSIYRWKYQWYTIRRTLHIIEKMENRMYKQTRYQYQQVANILPKMERGAGKTSPVI